jgi:uncharacterized protein YebE (UPF0316 family)
MKSTVADFLSIDPEIFNYFVLPLLIFMARIMDVSINTLRIIFMLNGKKMISTMLGFFESLIWLIAISQIFQNLDSVITYLAYAGGFASGVFVGMILEEKLAIGNLVIRIITVRPANQLIAYFDEHSYRYSNVNAVSKEGPVNILFTVIKRGDLKKTIETIKKFNPRAFYTVEGVKKVSEELLLNQN